MCKILFVINSKDVKKFMRNKEVQEKEKIFNKKVIINHEVYKTLVKLSEEKNISLSDLVNQCIDYTLENLEE